MLSFPEPAVASTWPVKFLVPKSVHDGSARANPSLVVVLTGITDVERDLAVAAPVCFP